MMPLSLPVSKQIYRREAETGFTLIEVMVVLAIMGIAMAIAVPSLRSLMDNQKMKSATFDLVTTVMQARSEAIKFGATTGASISISAKGDDYNNGWCIVFSGTSTCTFPDPGSDTPVPAADVMQINAPIANVVFTVTSCPSVATGPVPCPTRSTGSCPITFGRSGRLSCGTSVKIQVDNDSGGGAMPRCVTIDASGNAMTKVEACT